MVMVYKSFNAYKRRLERLQKQIAKSSGHAVTKKAEWIALRAASLAPKETGSLINSIRWQRAGRGDTIVQVVHLNPGDQNPNWAGNPYNYAGAMSEYLSKVFGVDYSERVASKIKTGNPNYAEEAIAEGVMKFKNEVKTIAIDAIKKSQ